MLSRRFAHIPILGVMTTLLIGTVACAQVALPTDEPSIDAVAVIEPTAVPPTEAPPTAVPPIAEPATAVPATAVPATIAPPTAVPPTAAPAVVAAPANGDWSTYTEVVDYDRQAIGNPLAELTIVEFSDFM